MKSIILPPQACPVCGANAGFTVFCPASFLKNEEKEIIECKNCGTSVLWPMPSEKDFSDYYGKTYFNFDRDSEVGKGYYYAEILKKIKTKNRYLEIGSAMGWFLYGIKNNSDWEISAFETGKTAADFPGKNSGLTSRKHTC